MSNCIKSRKNKCPLKNNCFGLVDDSDDCKCRLEDYQQGRADEQEFVEKKCKELGIDYTLIYTCNSTE